MCKLNLSNKRHTEPTISLKFSRNENIRGRTRNKNDNNDEKVNTPEHLKRGGGGFDMELPNKEMRCYGIPKSYNDITMKMCVRRESLLISFGSVD